MRDEFLSGITKKFEDLGINPENVKILRIYEGSIKVDAEITEKPENPNSLALTSNAVKQLVNAGDFDITVDNMTFSLDPDETLVTPLTASQVGSEVTTTPVTPGSSTPSVPLPADDDDDLSKTDKIIIGAVCGGVLLLTLFIVFYCTCKSKRNKEEDPNTIYDNAYMEPKKATIKRQGFTYDKPVLYA
ncbi:hypothetical protein ElyMa_006932100 [Elysia marginata]|uniref:SEA domain-containing protein n=1 Tax=Elysia marginata TaxID=1093978 RepID=A0AAV4JH90_9GAST|nr:hypothetical protein ElyMa_006932100 [Elysia marginata]